MTKTRVSDTAKTVFVCEQAARVRSLMSLCCERRFIIRAFTLMNQHAATSRHFPSFHRLHSSGALIFSAALAGRNGSSPVSQRSLECSPSRPFRASAAKGSPPIIVLRKSA
jgi:hypothetical protein